MMECPGIYFDGQRAKAQDALLRQDAEQWILGDPECTWEIAIPKSQAYWESPLGSGPRILRLDQGGEFHCPLADHPFYPQKNLAPWLEAKWSLSLVACLVLLGLFLSFAKWGLPWMAEKGSALIPAQIEEELGRRSLAQLDGQLMQASQASPQQKAKMEEVLQSLRKIPQLPHYHIELRSSPLIGANAFALPGGTLVVTDQMLQEASVPALIGVLSHECGHLQKRHALRGILEQMGFWALLSLMAGDLGGIYHSMLTLPAALMQMSYSRDFEREADAYAVQSMKSIHVAPTELIALLQKLSPSGEEAKIPDWAKFLQSHPLSEERAHNMRELWQKP